MKIAINKLHPFYNHPFKVIDNAEMDDLVYKGARHSYSNHSQTA